MSKVILFSAQTTDDNSEPFTAIGAGIPGMILESMLTVYGIFGGAAAELQYYAEDGNWYPTNDDLIVKSGAYFTKFNSNVSYRLSLSGASASTNIGSTVYNAV